MQPVATGCTTAVAILKMLQLQLEVGLQPVADAQNPATATESRVATSWSWVEFQSFSGFATGPQTTNPRGTGCKK